MSACIACGCLSNQNSKIDDKEITFFPFPEDVVKKEEWLKNCQPYCITENNEHPHLCELHFEKTNFTDSKELKPSAVPTVFTKVEECQRKRKAEAIYLSESSKSPPLKQTKLDEESNNLVVPKESSFFDITDEMELEKKNHENMPMVHELSLNVSMLLKSELNRELKIGKKVYRLTIQIDKVHGKPCPRSKKLMALKEINKKKQRCHESVDNIDLKLSQKVYKKVACAKGSCKLKRAMYESESAFQCEHCNKYYVVKRNDNPERKNNFCTICSKTFPSPQTLYNHIKVHFICDMCQTECNSQVTYDKHVRLHVSTAPLHPYKCHQCTEIFELKEDLRQHYPVVHPTIKLQNTILQVTPSALTPQMSQQKDFRCVSCNVTFRNEQAYRNHVNSHKKKEGLRCSISETNNIYPVPNPLTGSQIGILRAVKFSCTVCSKEFDNVGEVDKHTRTHLEEDTEGDRKCNICKKHFKTSVEFSEHVKIHLSRAHPCPICSKAFINRTTLNIHLKTHGEA